MKGKVLTSVLLFSVFSFPLVAEEGRIHFQGNLSGITCNVEAFDRDTVRSISSETTGNATPYAAAATALPNVPTDWINLPGKTVDETKFHLRFDSCTNLRKRNLKAWFSRNPFTDSITGNLHNADTARYVQLLDGSQNFAPIRIIRSSQLAGDFAFENERTYVPGPTISPGNDGC